MTMDPNSTETVDYINGFKVEDSFQNGFQFDIPSPDLNFMNMNVPPVMPPEPEPGILVPSITISSDGSSFSAYSDWTPMGESYSPPNDSDSTDPVLRYISQMLMEENVEDEPYMFNDYLALEDTEKSLYEVIGGEKYHPNMQMESPNGNLSGSNGHSNTSISTGSETSNYVDHRGVGDVEGSALSLSQAPYSLQPTSEWSGSHFSVNSVNSLSNINNGLMESSVSELLVKNIFSDKESMLQFQKGFEEASKFIPSNKQLDIDLESNTFPIWEKGDTPKVVVKVEKDERESPSDGLIGRKNHERDDQELEDERSTKQSATYAEESDLSEVFDKMFLCTEGKSMCGINETVRHGEADTLQKKEQSNGSGVGKTRSKKTGKKKETVDLRTLLILCAQAVSADDRRTAGELLKQIKLHSSPRGDGTQRLAYIFANGLEARLDGSGALIHNFYASLASKKTKAADTLKAYKAYLCACPFAKLAIVFANKTICRVSQKASVLHIVDFGILYGFQWPILIQHLSERPGGPPKLRITGIEIPLRGFRPAERIEETGRHLAKYCQRFGVPFEYNPVAVENWETIRIEDIKINSNEILAVNSLFRFQNLLDETADVNCPRNAVLNLIRKMNPNIFVHNIVNGAYNAPFFVTRFKEALFHFSAMFDVFENTLPREEPARLIFEREFFGREAMNVIACEGSTRVQRPETYKQWQNRTIRAGFKPLLLDQELMKIVRNKLKVWYHKDFIIDEDNNWMLQGWKGRILYGSSCWVPA
ncbi:SCARECROW-like 14, GRAS (GAI, RGA, SCR) 2, ARABIDOPSIS THALIANA GRAS (GAI, RGA, SCR) 2 [Hibiscus trionum]|uniref:SCARECROW-like 14, GRAS (GAI, RGA, SCR) 2, ARABIDOPSIS THALIANA GRAS (GAI, RGA, SCR) 2 n=1 Tax=Hibiscus trionum TaxID=183268 RepID=A0A9W7MDX3_HIBTR|nr:SCARECROW-like 14, GRAS (GAI, RGA, SCR) 2, ARABIDOPSIS THALIANA GRAS (GAI, RGA, SCR) 2 [Hibiscus trionum]